jgi:phosphate transport system permease protein
VTEPAAALLLATLGAALVGGGAAIAAALWLSEFAPRPAVAPLRRVCEIAAAVPSIVWGQLALSAAAPRMAREGIAPLPLVAVLSVMVAPALTLLALDALRRTPDDVREASLALGASRWQTAWRAVLPAARDALLASLVRTVGRACAEAAVLLWLTTGLAPHGAVPVAIVTALVAGRIERGRGARA